MQVPSLHNYHLLLQTATVVLAPTVVLRHASSALLALPHLLDLLLFLSATLARLATTVVVVIAWLVRQVLLQLKEQHKSLNAHAVPAPMFTKIRKLAFAPLALLILRRKVLLPLDVSAMRIIIGL
jgi:hypothetical protein